MLFGKKLFLAIAAMLFAACVAAQDFAAHSILAEGRWYKIPVDTAGVYKITTREVSALDNAPCNKIALYGLPGGMLSANNISFHTND